MRQQKDLGLWNQFALSLRPGPLSSLFTFYEPQVASSGDRIIIVSNV